jgi:hypothetical protein
MDNPVKEHPNAALGGGSAFGGGLLVVAVVGWLGFSLSAADGVLIAGALTTGALLVGRKGIRGIVRMVWRGNEA